jgi:hypothetical protein
MKRPRTAGFKECPWQKSLSQADNGRHPSNLPQHQTTSHSLDLTKGEKLAAWFPDGKSLVEDLAGVVRKTLAPGASA